MKKSILSVFMIAAALFCNTAYAQQKVNLNLGDQTVATVNLEEGDYIAFGRPEGVPEQKDVEITKTDDGKNYVTYKVETKEEGKAYQHVLLKKAYVDLLYMKLNGGASLDETDEAAMKNIFQTLILAGYGSTGYGTQTYTCVNGEKDANGVMQFIPSGQDYYLVTCGVTVAADNTPSLDDDMSWTKIHTAAPAESSEKLTVEYKGLDANGKAFFDVQSTQGVKTLHMVLGTAKSIDEFINVYGYDYMMFTQGSDFTRAQWIELGNDNEQVWNIDNEGDYSFYVLGIDNDGNWVKAQVLNQHIKPSAGNDCPEVDITNYMSGDSDESGIGELAVQYEIKTKAESIKKAKMLIMEEDKWDDALNEYMKSGNYEKPSDAWAVYMDESEGATDVTDVVKAFGNKFSFKRSFTADERGWYVIVLAVTDDYGTTVTRAAFNAHLALSSAEWNIMSRTFPVSDASAAKKGQKVMTGKVVMK